MNVSCPDDEKLSPSADEWRTVAPRGSRVVVAGIARAAERRTDAPRRSTQLHFRLERFDAAGNCMAPITVRLPDHRSGHVRDGDVVQVRGWWQEDAVEARRIVNDTTGVTVRGGAATALERAAIIAALIASLVVVILVLH